MASELKPCPFCGAPEDELMIFADPEEAFDNSGPSRRIQCAGCHIEAPFYPSEAEAVAAWNTRPAPAATLTGLETVEHQYWRDQTQEWLPTGFPDRYRKDGFQVRELVTRSQADELLAAERAKYRDAMEKLVESQRETLVWQLRAINLKSDNAVKDKRLKEANHV